jgi:hypothetical protein
MNLAEATRRAPLLLALRCDDSLQISLERNTRNVPHDGQFHVRVRGRIIFSGSFAEAQARYERAWEAQHLRHRADALPQASPRQRQLPPFGVRALPCARRPDGGYAGRRRLSWRALVPLPSLEAPEEPPRLLREWLREKESGTDPL